MGRVVVTPDGPGRWLLTDVEGSWVGGCFPTLLKSACCDFLHSPRISPT